jgi:rubrerythrin
MSYIRTGFWCPTNTGENKQLWFCQVCGSVVHDRDAHDAWHKASDA